jgi:pimeloyl-ACP methyl ester carboxylesterase
MSVSFTVPAGDTVLHAVDEPGGTPGLLFLNGALATLRDWDRVIQRLAGRYRTVRYDTRARGKSGTSADYSLRAEVEDIGRVIEAAGLRRPVLVGWSYGATLAVRYAARHPGQVAGLVLVDGAYPVAVMDPAKQERVRAQFRRMGWIMRTVAAFGRSARMSPAEAADVMIGMDAANGTLRPDFEALDCPAVYIVGTGAHSGATPEEMGTMRAAAANAMAVSPRVSVFGTVSASHLLILRRAPETVAAAIEDVVRQVS